MDCTIIYNSFLFFKLFFSSFFFFFKVHVILVESRLDRVEETNFSKKWAEDELFSLEAGRDALSEERERIGMEWEESYKRNILNGIHHRSMSTR